MSSILHYIVATQSASVCVIDLLLIGIIKQISGKTFPDKSSEEDLEHLICIHLCCIEGMEQYQSAILSWPSLYWNTKVAKHYGGVVYACTTATHDQLTFHWTVMGTNFWAIYESKLLQKWICGNLWDFYCSRNLLCCSILVLHSVWVGCVGWVGCVALRAYSSVVFLACLTGSSLFMDGHVTVIGSGKNTVWCVTVYLFLFVYFFPCLVSLHWWIYNHSVNWPALYRRSFYHLQLAKKTCLVVWYRGKSKW